MRLSAELAFGAVRPTTNQSSGSIVVLAACGQTEGRVLTWAENLAATSDGRRGENESSCSLLQSRSPFGRVFSRFDREVRSTQV